MIKVHDVPNSKRLTIYPSVGIVHPSSFVEVSISNYPIGTPSSYKLNQKMSIKTTEIDFYLRDRAKIID
jgi:hypothetical protein